MGGENTLKNRLLCCFIPALVFTLFALGSHADIKPELTVLFPDVNAPYDAIFQQINKGIKKEYQGPIKHIKLPKSFDPSDMAKTVKSPRVIALGKRGLAVAKILNNEKSVVVGALPIRPGQVSGVSLMAHPAPLFDALKKLAPKTRKIIVVYSKAAQWIIPIAKTEALSRNVTLEAISVSDIESAVKTYNEIFKREDLKNTAIWLTLDSVASNDRVIVPTILEKSWNKNMVIFSSKPTHAKRGALFSALPDNEKLGSQLASLISNEPINLKTGNVIPTESIKLAVNLRTAKHLGFKYSKKKRSSFALTFN